MAKRLIIALTGNPNSGKTTIFNNLTGARQHVGNYPGVTVEKIEGKLKYKGYEVKVIDLPGTYSLTAYSIDEVVARNFVVEEKPDIIINIIDTSNLERNLYLTTQFKELGVPLVLAFNMTDLAERQGLTIDKRRLSELLGVPIVSTVATKKRGTNELLDTVIQVCEGKIKLPEAVIGYGREIEEEITKLAAVLSQDGNLTIKYPLRWLALKLLESDSEVIKKIKESPNAAEILEVTKKSAVHIKGIFGDEPEAIIADRRYGFISGACSEAILKTYELRHSRSDQIDKVILNRILGLPIFLGVMLVLFNFIFKLSSPLMAWVEAGQEWAGIFFGGMLAEGSAVQSLAVEGIIGGVGSVLIFVPIIFLLFLAIALLEDSGYMARVAFIMDRLMHKIGLHGRSCIPMLLGFGCNLPAIMATRTIKDRKDRFVTILVNPFMSCGARLPVYALLIGAFFPGKTGGYVLFSLYFLGLMVAVVMAKIFRKYLFKGEASPFVMELPPYRLPTVKGLLIHMWERGVVYLRKAGTVIFAGCVVIWFLSNFPWNPPYSRNYHSLIEQAEGNEILISRLERQKAQEKLEKSYAGKIGKSIAPVFRPLGFDDWKISVGLTGGFIAKEIVVGTLGTLYSVAGANEEPESLRQALKMQTRSDGSRMYTPLVAYAFMVFVLLYMPCVAVLAVIKRETNSWRWPAFTAIYTTALAWLVSFIVYQGGRFLGLG